MTLPTTSPQPVPATAKFADGCTARAETRWWTAYAAHSSVDGTLSLRASEHVATPVPPHAQ